MKSLTIHYSEALVREAVRHFFIRSVTKRLGIPFLLACTLMSVALQRLLARGSSGWVVGLLVAGLLFAAAFLGAIYLLHFRSSVGRFREMRVPEATFAFNDEGFTVASDLGKITLPWSAVTEVWQFARVWLLLLSPAQFITLPTEDLDEETMSFLLERVARERAG